jgi:anti-sigma factor RsiW
MKLNNHERARKLLRADPVEGIPAGERDWLEAHLAGCAECSKESTSLAFVIGSLALLSETATPDIVRRTTLAVRRRAEELRNNRKQALPLWIAVGASSLWTMLTAPYIWSGFSWAGRLLHVSDPIWQVAFLMWWFLPCAVLGAVAGWRHLSRRTASSSWDYKMNWRSS